MTESTMGKTIAALRKKAGITQEELAAALNISAQAVSKWETSTSLPDTQTLPLIAGYFKVSVDYLFCGDEATHGNIYNKVYQKTASHPENSRESYEEALKLFACAHHGISHGNLLGEELVCGGKDFLYDKPAHISDYNGLSLLSGKGYGAIVTRDFFTNVAPETLDFSRPIFEILAKPNVLSVVCAIISMSDISISEIKEKLAISEQEMLTALDEGISSGLITEKTSKHKALGKTYEIAGIYHTCICILLATMAMQKLNFGGLSCCMCSGDYPIKFDKEVSE